MNREEKRFVKAYKELTKAFIKSVAAILENDLHNRHCKESKAVFDRILTVRDEIEILRETYYRITTRGGG